MYTFAAVVGSLFFVNSFFISRNDLSGIFLEIFDFMNGPFGFVTTALIVAALIITATFKKKNIQRILQELLPLEQSVSNEISNIKNRYNRLDEECKGLKQDYEIFIHSLDHLDLN